MALRRLCVSACSSLKCASTRYCVCDVLFWLAYGCWDRSWLLFGMMISVVCDSDSCLAWLRVSAVAFDSFLGIMVGLSFLPQVPRHNGLCGFFLWQVPWHYVRCGFLFYYIPEHYGRCMFSFERIVDVVVGVGFLLTGCWMPWWVSASFWRVAGCHDGCRLTFDGLLDAMMGVGFLLMGCWMPWWVWVYLWLVDGCHGGCGFPFDGLLDAMVVVGFLWWVAVCYDWCRFIFDKFFDIILGVGFHLAGFLMICWLLVYLTGFWTLW